MSWLTVRPRAEQELDTTDGRLQLLSASDLRRNRGRRTLRPSCCLWRHDFLAKTFSKTKNTQEFQIIHVTHQFGVLRSPRLADTNDACGVLTPEKESIMDECAVIELVHNLMLCREKMFPFFLHRFLWRNFVNIRATAKERMRGFPAEQIKTSHLEETRDTVMHYPFMASNWPPPHHHHHHGSVNRLMRQRDLLPLLRLIMSPLFSSCAQ